MHKGELLMKKREEEIESLNPGTIDIDALSMDELEDVSGGGCTRFSGTCEGFSGSCTDFSDGDDGGGGVECGAFTGGAA